MEIKRTARIVKRRAETQTENQGMMCQAMAENRLLLVCVSSSRLGRKKSASESHIIGSRWPGFLWLRSRQQRCLAICESVTSDANCHLHFHKPLGNIECTQGHGITHVVADRPGSLGHKGSGDSWQDSRGASVRFLEDRRAFHQAKHCIDQGPGRPQADNQAGATGGEHQQGKTESEWSVQDRLEYSRRPGWPGLGPEPEPEQHALFHQRLCVDYLPPSCVPSIPCESP